MIWAIAGFSVIAFAASFLATRIVQKSREALADSSVGVAALTSTLLEDDAKEAAVRAAGLRLLGHTWGIVWRLAVAFGAAVLPIYVGDRIGLAPIDTTLDLMVSPTFIVVSTIAVIVAVWLIAKLTRPDSAGSDYSDSERIIHMVAFTRAIQVVLMRFDDFVFGLLHRGRPEPQVLIITSLARGGTTACLNAFNSLDQIATYTYRDMPFITAPYVWSRISNLSSRKIERKERAHGDGLEIDLDSPEAFDEVLWRLLWPAKYRPEGIAVWESCDLDQAKRKSMVRAFDKVLAVRGPQAKIFVSKNNANLARLHLLPDLFPGCRIIVPMRRPATHAASLLRQHRNFVAQQAADPFVKRYMGDIGHFEFGLLHRPLLFPGFDPKAYSLESPDYWLYSWVAAFRYVRANLDRVQIVLQDELRASPDQTMKDLLRKNGIAFDEQEDFGQFFRRERDSVDDSVFSPALLAEAGAIYEDIAANRQTAAL